MNGFELDAKMRVILNAVNTDADLQPATARLVELGFTSRTSAQLVYACLQWKKKQCP